MNAPTIQAKQAAKAKNRSQDKPTSNRAISKRKMRYLSPPHIYGTEYKGHTHACNYDLVFVSCSVRAQSLYSGLTHLKGMHPTPALLQKAYDGIHRRSCHFSEQNQEHPLIVVPYCLPCALGAPLRHLRVNLRAVPPALQRLGHL